MSLSLKVQSIFTIVTPRRFFVQKRVPQGILDAISNFQGVMRDVLNILIDTACLVWIDYVIIWGGTAGELVDG